MHCILLPGVVTVNNFSFMRNINSCMTMSMLLSYMAHLTIDSLGDMFSSANQIMDWLAKVALLVAAEVTRKH